MAESEKKLKSLLMKVKEENEKAGLKCNIQVTKIIASSPTSSWQIDRATMEAVVDFICLDSKVTADNDHSHEIKRCLLISRKAMTNLNSISKSRDIPLLTKLHVGQFDKGPSYGFLWLWFQSVYPLMPSLSTSPKPQSQKTSQSDHMDHSLV